DYLSQKALQAPERSNLAFQGVQSTFSPRDDGNLWNVQLCRTSLLACFPRLESKFAFCTSTGR
ncbi:UNVERIFIED_CONTAM: hypothetical protein K2H54_062709, partial [Gekko kuhli]